MTAQGPALTVVKTERGLARPRESGRKQDILDSAEKLFSQDSYAAVSIRDIAAAADVNSALLRYHFGTKRDLYRSLFERRYHLITRQREATLRTLLDRPGPPEVTDIVECWVGPLVEFASDRKSRHFVDILARETSDATRDRQGVLAEYIDPSARVCIQALRRALPDVERSTLVHGYLWMIAAVMTTVSATGRAQRLGSQPVKRPDALTKPLVAFIVGGLNGIIGMAG